MKKIFILLFVIGMAIAITSVYAQSVEQKTTVLEVKRIGKTIRFTVEVDRDSALCHQPVNHGECYVLSQKIKKYVYVDASKTPNLNLEAGMQVFLHPKTKLSSAWNEDFGEKKFYSTKPIGFPWLTREGLRTEYWYQFDNANMAFIPIINTNISKYSIWEFQFIAWCWVLMLIPFARWFGSVLNLDEIDDDIFKILTPVVLGVSLGFCGLITVKYLIGEDWNNSILGYEPSSFMLISAGLINVLMLVVLILSMKGFLFRETNWFNRLILITISCWSLILLGADKPVLMIVTLILTTLYFCRYFIFDYIENFVIYLEKRKKKIE